MNRSKQAAVSVSEKRVLLVEARLSDLLQNHWVPTWVVRVVQTTARQFVLTTTPDDENHGILKDLNAFSARRSDGSCKCSLGVVAWVFTRIRHAKPRCCLSTYISLRCDAPLSSFSVVTLAICA